MRQSARQQRRTRRLRRRPPRTAAQRPPTAMAKQRRWVPSTLRSWHRQASQPMRLSLSACRRPCQRRRQRRLRIQRQHQLLCRRSRGRLWRRLSLPARSPEMRRSPAAMLTPTRSAQRRLQRLLSWRQLTRRERQRRQRLLSLALWRHPQLCWRLSLHLQSRRMASSNRSPQKGPQKRRRRHTVPSSSRRTPQMPTATAAAPWRGFCRLTRRRCLKRPAASLASQRQPP